MHDAHNIDEVVNEVSRFESGPYYGLFRVNDTTSNGERVEIEHRDPHHILSHTGLQRVAATRRGIRTTAPGTRGDGPQHDRGGRVGRRFEGRHDAGRPRRLRSPAARALRPTAPESREGR